MTSAGSGAANSMARMPFSNSMAEQLGGGVDDVLGAQRSWCNRGRGPRGRGRR